MSETNEAYFPDKKSFIKFLKNTPTIPPPKNKQTETYARNKENMGGMNNGVMEEKMKVEDRKKKIRIHEGDFNKIGELYVLDGTKLRKRESYEEELQRNRKKMVEQQLKEEPKDKKGAMKALKKMKYLQERGLLKPQEEELLREYQKYHPQLNEIPQPHFPSARNHTQQSYSYFNPNFSSQHFHLPTHQQEPQNFHPSFSNYTSNSFYH